MQWLQRLATTCLVLVVSLVTLTAEAEMKHAKASDIQAHMTWVRAVPPVATTTAAYMMLHNYSQQDDRLIAIESPVSEVVEMHATEMNDGIMKMTKLQAGGISPLALVNRGFDVILDSSAREHEQIHVSGGQRGLNIRLRVDDLVRLTSAKIGEISALMDAINKT